MIKPNLRLCIYVVAFTVVAFVPQLTVVVVLMLTLFPSITSTVAVSMFAAVFLF